jgi:predicted kinase
VPVQRITTARGGDAEGLGRALVVVGGLPGSGKTSLLRRWLAAEPTRIVGLDSEDVAARVRAAGVRLPYRLLRPAVHLLHRARVLRVVLGTAPLVVLTDPWTDPRWRSLVLRAAHSAGRALRLVALDAPPAVAAQGQDQRRRVVPARSMRRHAARWRRFAATFPEKGDVLVVDRRAAADLTLADVLGKPPSVA